MKPFKMIGITVLAFALGSLVMVGAPLLAEQAVAMVQKQKAVTTPDATEQLSVVATVAVAAAQEATPVQQ
jgi:hypothetical protein